MQHGTLKIFNMKKPCPLSLRKAEWSSFAFNPRLKSHVCQTIETRHCEEQEWLYHLQVRLSLSPDPLPPFSNTLTENHRARRVKCDERKPHCIRCLQSGKNCEGYTRSSPSLPLSKLSLSPKASQISKPMGNRTEQRALRWFHARTVPDLLGYFEPDFWRCRVLKLSQLQSPIRHAVIALGALHERCCTNKVGVDDWEQAKKLFPLQHNQSAIQLLRTQILNHGDESMETAMICCVLFICFEILQGNHAAAKNHLDNGLRMFTAWRQIPVLGSQAVEAKVDEIPSPASSWNLPCQPTHVPSIS